MLNVSVYYQPSSLVDALRLLSESNGELRPLAGGTDIIPALAKHEFSAGLVDMTKISDLKGINLSDGVMTIGSLSSFNQIETSELIRIGTPVLAQAAASVGSPQIRNQGTLGGNIANASPAADTVTALVALDARVKLASLGGSRSVKVSELLCGVGKTSISRQEVIEEIFFSVPPPGTISGFIKLGRRKALAIARMNLAVTFTLEDGRIARARVAIGAVGPNPSRNLALEAVLKGQQPSLSLIEEFVTEAEREVFRVLGSRPSVSYKSEAIKGIARDLLNRLFFTSEQVVIG